MNDELIILKVLRDNDGNPQTAAKLFLGVNAQSPTPLTTHDITARLNALAQLGQVFATGSRDGTKYIIMALGRARLAEANL